MSTLLFSLLPKVTKSNVQFLHHNWIPIDMYSTHSKPWSRKDKSSCWMPSYHGKSDIVKSTVRIHVFVEIHLPFSENWLKHCIKRFSASLRPLSLSFPNICFATHGTHFQTYLQILTGSYRLFVEALLKQHHICLCIRRFNSSVLLNRVHCISLDLIAALCKFWSSTKNKDLFSGLRHAGKYKIQSSKRTHFIGTWRFPAISSK